jgi:hypothetical protein
MAIKNKIWGSIRPLFGALVILIITFFCFTPVLAVDTVVLNNPVSAENKNLVADWKSFLLFYTGSVKLTLDSDGDGYGDDLEIENGYSPFNPLPGKIRESDVDHDGLNDYLEIKFKTDPFNADSDGDSYSDGSEVDLAYNPNSSSTKKLDRHLEINLKKQELTYFVAAEAWKSFSVSSGKASMPTPKGNFKILNKIDKAWSKTYKLWMPFWMGLGKGSIGIHELPIWPSGYREGANHLGTPVSHGCIRLGIGAAKYIYDRVDVGTMVVIK